MSYDKTVWNDGDVITAEKLNNIENGVEGANDGSSILQIGIENSYLNKTWNEIKTAFENGVIPVVFYVNSETSSSTLNIINGVDIHNETYQIYVLGHDDVFGYVEGNPNDYPYIVD